jgi:hypothetical protein
MRSLRGHGLFGMRPEAAVEFARVPVTCVTPGGLPYRRWLTHGMPKLGEYQYLLDIVFFLYPDVATARAGTDAGGTGFFVTIPSVTYPDHYHHCYAVTNWHVAIDGSPVIRVNKKNAPPEIFPFEPHEWSFIPGDHDIAVLPLELDPDVFRAAAIDAPSFFLTEQDIPALEINAAEDVFMLGRFMDYDGVEENCPSMRFGNISMMAAKVRQPTGFNGASHVVDMHSRTGFSGSPVFVYRTAGSIFAKPNTIMGGGHLLKLLGILWGQFTEEWDIRDKSTKQSAPPVLDGKSISGWSGMSLVSPASAIWKVLQLPKLVQQRAEIDAQLHAVYGSAPVRQSLAETR